MQLAVARPPAQRSRGWWSTVGHVPEHWEPYLEARDVCSPRDRVLVGRAVDRLGNRAPLTRPSRSGRARAVWILEATAPALVLGSTQPWIDVPGLEVCRRRSGGGAVLVRPGEVLWIDVLLPRGDHSGRTTSAAPRHWLGETWRDALGAGVVHTGQMIRTPWSNAICFAGVGPGEVLIDDAKVVGVSQRRSRAGARFQCAALRVWDSTELAHLRCGEWREVADDLDRVRRRRRRPRRPRGRVPRRPRSPLNPAFARQHDTWSP